MFACVWHTRLSFLVKKITGVPPETINFHRISSGITGFHPVHKNIDRRLEFTGNLSVKFFYPQFFWPKNWRQFFLDTNKLLGSKRILVSKQLLGSKKVGGQKDFGVKTIFGVKKFFSVKNIFWDQKIFAVSFGMKRIFVKKTLGSKQLLGS